MFILVQSLVSSLVREDAGTRTAGPSLAPVLPGVNLPLSDIGLYLLSITCASLFHELGHAVAAADCNVRVEGVGFAVFVLIPVAFVELGTDCFTRAHVVHRLKIVCAGVWHNLVLGLCCAILLFSHSVILFPVCDFGSGVTVVSTPMNDEAALNAGDLIQSVNECPVSGKESWRECLAAVSQKQLTGYCLTREFVDRERRDSPGDKCCAETLNHNHLCFLDQENRGICLPARKVVDKSRTCDIRTVCPSDSMCVTPEASDNRTRLFRVTRGSGHSYLYWGNGQHLLLSTKVSDCNPRVQWLTLVQLVDLYDSLLRYLISFSLALAVLNVVPCFFLDGQFILSASVERVCGDRVSRVKQKNLCRALSLTGSVLILASVVSAFLILVTRNNG